MSEPAVIKQRDARDEPPEIIDAAVLARCDDVLSRAFGTERRSNALGE